MKDVDILYIELRDGKYEYSEEIAEGVILDLDKNGEIMAIEILNTSKRLDNSVVEKITEQYLQPYKEAAKVTATEHKTF